MSCWFGLTVSSRCSPQALSDRRRRRVVRVGSRGSPETAGGWSGVAGDAVAVAVEFGAVAGLTAPDGRLARFPDLGAVGVLGRL